MTDISKKIVEKIKAEHIEPESRWKFLAKRSLVWAGLSVAAVLGALSLGLIVLSLTELDEEIFSFGPGRLLSPPLLRAIPLLWLTALAAFLGLAIVGFRNTRRGYRYRVAGIAGIFFLVVMIGGAAAHFAGVNRMADTSLRGTFPGYGRFVENREHFWSQPENGFLAGEIGTVRRNGFSLTALDGKEWDVIVTEETAVRPMMRIAPHEKVKVIGDKTKGNVFEAEDIRPWERPKTRMPGESPRNRERQNENFPDGMRYRE